MLAHRLIAGCIITLNEQDHYFKHSVYVNHSKILTTVVGGKERYHSVYRALTMLKNWANDNDWVLIHDAARPCLRATDVDKLIQEVGNDAVGGILATPVTDTLKMSQNNLIQKTVNRRHLWQAQTPQMFRLGLLEQALTSVIDKKINITDDAQAIELLGYLSKIVVGCEQNIKITYPDDLKRANVILGTLEATK